MNGFANFRSCKSVLTINQSKKPVPYLTLVFGPLTLDFTKSVSKNDKLIEKYPLKHPPPYVLLLLWQSKEKKQLKGCQY